MTSPVPGQPIKIVSYKHDKSFHRSWDRTLVLHASPNVIIGGNNRVRVTESDGRHWRTREPAICTFGRGQWFNSIAMLRRDGIYYYCNIGSPFNYKNGVLSYIDYDLDVKVFPDGSYIVLDKDEYTQHSRLMKYPEDVVRRVQQGVQQVIRWVEEQKGPFQPGFVERWYDRYVKLEKKDSPSR
ncbi:MAG: DUF402 domain-containing protein [Bacillaceae bacterium]|nr:DUF402 domain-containing protein [Bacillaceae bacterium]